MGVDRTMAYQWRFNPRPPCGERPGRAYVHDDRNQFQSTPPVRGATSNGYHDGYWSEVSIHAPRAGSDIMIIPLNLSHVIRHGEPHVPL